MASEREDRIDDQMSALIKTAKGLFDDGSQRRLTVIANQGRYRVIFKLKLDRETTAHFRVSDDADKVDIILTGERLSDEAKRDFAELTENFGLKEQIVDALLAVDHWWRESEHLKMADKAAVSAEKSVEKKKPKSRKAVNSSAHQKTKQDEQESRGMKPAQDVIARIIWDPTLPAGRFSVGYIDRFVGIIEKPFESFNWQNFAAVDPESCADETTAIPRHRIRFFKCDDVIVWDKTKRLDLIFNTGTAPEKAPLSVYDVIATNNPNLQSKAEDQEGTSFEEQSENMDTQDLDVGKRPDFYLSIPVTSPEVIARLTEIQADFQKHYGGLVSKRIPAEKFHVTLCLFCAENCTAIVQSLNEVRDELADILRSLKPQIRGLGVLGAVKKYTVLCGRIDRKQMQPIINLLAAKFVNHGVDCYWPENMHLTLLKFRTPESGHIWQEVSALMMNANLHCALTNNLEISLKTLGGLSELWSVDGAMTSEACAVPEEENRK